MHCMSMMMRLSLVKRTQLRKMRLELVPRRVHLPSLRDIPSGVSPLQDALNRWYLQSLKMALVQGTENALLVGSGNILRRWDLARLLTLQNSPLSAFSSSLFPLYPFSPTVSPCSISGKPPSTSEISSSLTRQTYCWLADHREGALAPASQRSHK